MDINPEQQYFSSHRAVDVANYFRSEFPKFIQDQRLLLFQMESLIADSQRILNATTGAQSTKDISRSHPIAHEPSTVVREALDINSQGQVIGTKPVIEQEQVISQTVSTSEFPVFDHPNSISVSEALEYIASTDNPTIFREIYDLPVAGPEISGFRTMLITQLCENSERILKWLETDDADKELRKILLEAVISDTASIARYKARKSLGYRDDLPITRLITSSPNLGQIEDFYKKILIDLSETH